MKTGQLLAILEIPEMADDQARAQAAVERSRAEVTRAKDELQHAPNPRMTSRTCPTSGWLAVSEEKPGLVAQQEIDDAHSKDLVAEAQICRGKIQSGGGRGAGARQRSRAAASQDHVRLHPRHRAVHRRDHQALRRHRIDDPGRYRIRSQAMPLVRLSENSLLRLILPVPESAVPTVHIGQQVDVRVPTLNRSFPGKSGAVLG